VIARNQLYDGLRKRCRDCVVDFELSSIEDLRAIPATRLARHREHLHLITALRRLPLEQQTLLELHYVQEMEIAELAEVFDASAGTIRGRLHRARKQLRELLESDAAVARTEDESGDA
jgi:RNA polymerase sigma-70 factor (ECF subfamily)